ncbi:MAG: hypothetical protein FK734_21790 [Asgard group archaeon]|nr:hypothetical protein [Asgard group archaeon]
MSKIKVVSISHQIDPDGIGAQAIIFRYFRELNIEPVGLLADYYNFEEVFKQAIAEEPNVLIVSDIGLNSTLIQNIIEPLRSLNARKIWIDHHNATDEMKEMLSSATDEFIHDTSVCAAEIVQQRFLPNDPISKEIAQIGHNGDFDVNDRLAMVFYTLIDYHRNSMDDLIRIREIFAQGDFKNQMVFDEYIDAYKVFEAERDRIKNSKQTITIAGLTITIASSAILPRGKVTKFLSEICSEDILVAIDTTNFRIGLRSEKIDVATVASYFGGGGHKHRSGFTYQNATNDDLTLSEKFLSELEKAILAQQNKS